MVSKNANSSTTTNETLNGPSDFSELQKQEKSKHSLNGTSNDASTVNYSHDFSNSIEMFSLKTMQN